MTLTARFITPFIIDVTGVAFHSAHGMSLCSSCTAEKASASIQIVSATRREPVAKIRAGGAPIVAFAARHGVGRPS
jgi:hypothetical protein